MFQVLSAEFQVNPKCFRFDFTAFLVRKNLGDQCLEVYQPPKILILPSGFQSSISGFSRSFRKDVWPKAQLLLIGVIFCPGSRTVYDLCEAKAYRKRTVLPSFIAC